MLSTPHVTSLPPLPPPPEETFYGNSYHHHHHHSHHQVVYPHYQQQQQQHPPFFPHQSDPDPSSPVLSFDRSEAPFGYHGCQPSDFLLHHQGGYSSSSAFPSPEISGIDSAAARPERRKVGGSSNKKERRRTLSINTAFANLRDCIPNVPCDTKLSKIKTLRLATSYIHYLKAMLSSENPDEVCSGGFRADIHKKWKEKSEEQKRRELEAELNNNRSRDNDGLQHQHHSQQRVSLSGKGGARTGWPLQQVWALELKR